jgi:hypothetical protein
VDIQLFGPAFARQAGLHGRKPEDTNQNNIEIYNVGEMSDTVLFL